MKASLMSQEIAHIPAVVERQIGEAWQQYIAAGQKIRALQGAIVTNARGTSDHAASYFKSLVEISTGRPVASIPPSTSSVYQAKLQLAQAAMLSISQSGGSPDLIQNQANAKLGGAMTFALSNTADSPLSCQADVAMALCAGAEQAVAATKSFAASLLALDGIARGIAGIVATPNLASVAKMEQQIAAFDSARFVELLHLSDSLYTISRGARLALAQEAALKLKETCLIHAEAFSAAEVIHGPMVLARKKITVLAFHTKDAGQESIVRAIEKMAANGANIIEIPALTQEENPVFSAIVQIAQFYRSVEQLSRELGHDPDQPPMLQKVTETV